MSNEFKEDEWNELVERIDGGSTLAELKQQMGALHSTLNKSNPKNGRGLTDAFDALWSAIKSEFSGKDKVGRGGNSNGNNSKPSNSREKMLPPAGRGGR